MAHTLVGFVMPVLLNPEGFGVPAGIGFRMITKLSSLSNKPWTSLINVHWPFRELFGWQFDGYFLNKMQ